MADPLPIVSIARLLRLTPNAHPLYRLALAHANAVLVCFGIRRSTLRLEHFLAQILHETGGLTVTEENLRYTTPERLMAVWPSRFPTRDAALPFVSNPSGLAEHVYSGRLGNGPEGSGDGWRYRGRGLIQLTGRSAYEQASRALDFDFVSSPDALASEDLALPAAAWFWRSASCSPMADADSIIGVTRAINGGLTGLAERRAWLARVRGDGVVMAGLASGS